MAQLPNESQFGDYGEWPGRDVLDSGGERLGGVREIYLDRETGRPEWVLVDVDGDEARFVPLADADVDSATIRVAHDATVIRNAPGIGSEPRIDQSEERRLYAHYGLGYSEDDSGSGLPADEPSAPPTAWGAPDATETRAPDTPEATTSSWSEVAPSDTADAPPPGEPPSPLELERADIPEPPAATDRAADPIPFVSTLDTPEPAASAPEHATEWSTPGESASTDFDTLSETVMTPAPEPETPHATAPEVALPLTPDVIPSEPATPEPVGAAPSPPTPPAAAAPDPVSPPPPSPAREAPRASTPPPRPAPEPSGGALALIKSRPGGIAIGVVVAAVLLLIIRRLR